MIRTSGLEKKTQQVDYSINNMNQLLETNEAKFTYDKAGNPLSRKTATTTSTFEYYGDGKLKQAININDDNCTYIYDCLDRLSTMNCTRAGVFNYYYHHNAQLGGDSLAAILYPNGSLIHFVYVPFTSIVLINWQDTHVSLPLVESNSNNLLTPNTVSQIDNLPVTQHLGQIVPLINQDSSVILNENKKPFSFELDIYSPLDLFDTTSFAANLYQPSVQNLNNQIDSLSNSILNLNNIEWNRPPTFDSLLGMQVPDFGQLGSLYNEQTNRLKSTMNTVERTVNKYKDPICNTASIITNFFFS